MSRLKKKYTTSLYWMNTLSKPPIIVALQSYSCGVMNRLTHYVWLFLLVFTILLLNAAFIGSGVQNGGGWGALTIKGLFVENSLFLPTNIWVAFVAVLLPSMLPNKGLRSVLILLELVALLLFHFIDIYLISVYGIPFNESFVFTLFGTNSNEAKAFLRTLQIDWALFLREIVKLVICAGVAVGIQFLLNRRRVNTL